MSAVPSVRVRDAEATRGKLLAAATDVFAHKGLAGARLREIADMAGVTVPLLCHHFKDKDTLYAEVVERAVGRFVALGWGILEREGSFRQRIVAADIAERGMVLTGGGALLRDDHERMSERWAVLRGTLLQWRDRPDAPLIDDATRQQASDFIGQYAAHIATEEGRVYPAARSGFDAAGLARIGAEMQGRRRGG